ncbi:MAG: DNA polymerase III subunit delta [Eubacteriales bacterium]|nr:DNA polymerase III subunit delta [Eubacteriales bacterium]
MKTINEHIKINEFKSVYLIYGEEEYLKKQYRDKLKNAIISDDTMNYSYYEGDKIQLNEVLAIAYTMQFFSERRLIIIENSVFIKSSNEKLADYIKTLPDYLIMVFVESAVDKRNKVYKAIAERGYITEMNTPSTGQLQRWILGILKAEGKTIGKAAIELLLSKTGAGMDLIRTELEKLTAYCIDRNEVTLKDVEAVCVSQTTNKIFDMVAAMAMKDTDLALRYYYDLLTLKEPPMRILYLIVRQFNGLLQTKDGINRSMAQSEMARAIGVAPFVVGKYLGQSKLFTQEQLMSALEECAGVEEAVKTGRLDDKIAVEMILVKYSSKDKA